jgi:PhoH-like ATPase
MSIYGINLGKNKEQIELARLINENNKHIIFCEGCAGTGKTFIAVACALQLLEDKKYKHIIYSRSLVSVGKDLGYLPGDEKDKTVPYMRALTGALKSLVRCQKKNNKNTDVRIEVEHLLEKFDIVPISLERGDNIPDDTIMIIDEAQNCDWRELRALLTRGETYSKIIILGSFRQIDAKEQMKKEKCDFQQVWELLEDLPYVGTVHLTESMRSPWCREIDEIFDDKKFD